MQFSLWIFSPKINAENEFILFCWCRLAINKKWQENKLENHWFVTNYSQDIYKQLQVHNFNAAHEILFNHQVR